MSIDNNYWKAKYLKYKQKTEKLKHFLEQSGGSEDNKKYLKILHKIKEGLKTKGYVFWFDDQGKVLAQGLDTKSAKANMVKVIMGDKTKWNSAIITELVIEFDPKNIMDEKSGGLSISIDLNKVILDGNRLSIQMKNKNNSLFSMCYKYDELSSFKLSDLKKFSLFVSNETLKKFGSDIFHYEDMTEYI